MAQYGCAPGYTYYNGVCQPMRAPGCGNPVSGAVSGEAAGAASGYATGGTVGTVVGGALGTATGAITGTANRSRTPRQCRPATLGTPGITAPATRPASLEGRARRS
jgi:hypothetical protein